MTSTMTPMTQNEAAFLQTISRSEGTDAVENPDGSARLVDPYRVCYGKRHMIQDWRDHPAITGEWIGESLANLGPAYAGLISSAAGKYQITRHTWQACKAVLSLPDFGPDSQDQAALLLIRQRDALVLVNAGQLEQAVAKCNSVWASFPGGLSNQPYRELAELTQFFTAAGGVLAVNA